MENTISLGFLFFIITFAGFYFAYLYGRHTKQFRWREYFAIIILPIIFVLLLSYMYGEKILVMFLVSAFVGFGLEYLIGLAYEKTLNKKLWVYNRMSVGGYTSVLSIPLWGVAGVFFWFLSKMIGL